MVLSAAERGLCAHCLTAVPLGLFIVEYQQILCLSFLVALGNAILVLGLFVTCQLK
jgi:hypothetical protein